LWWPVPDLHAPSLAETSELVGRLRTRLDAGGMVLVHCGAGIGRAGTIAAAVLMSLGMPRTEAVAVVAFHRPMAGPEAGAQAALLESLGPPGDEAGTAERA
jgi:protein-tyrosine phosphatase